MTPRGPEVPLRSERAYACPECGSWMDMRHNPSYGSGLAVHPYLLVCGKCGWTNFIPSAPHTPAAPPPRRGGLFGWFRARRR